MPVQSSFDEGISAQRYSQIQGILHPLIHFGFGIEFEQPEIIAEGLAQTAIHPPWSDSFFFETDEAATQANTPSKPLVDILAKIRADKSLSTAARWDDQNQMRDGPLARARQSMVNYASQWRVDPENLEEATAEMINAAGKSHLDTFHPETYAKLVQSILLAAPNIRPSK